MHVFDSLSININNILILFCPFCIYFFPMINQLAGKDIFNLNNFHCLFHNQMHVFDNWLIDKTYLSISFCLFYIITLYIIKLLNVKTCFWGQFSESINHTKFLYTLFGLHLSIYLGVLVLIELSLIVDFFLNKTDKC